MTPTTPARAKILFIDDDANILAALARGLRRGYALDVALGPQTGLQRLEENGPYAVVVTDMNMPGMNGLQFLTQARQIAPETVRMMLTGNVDQQTVVDALHQGEVFRFLLKPTTPEQMAVALDAGLAHYKQAIESKEVLEATLKGSVRLLMEVLASVAPESFDYSQHLRRRLRSLVEALGQESDWELETIALLSQIGLVTVPASLVSKARLGCTLSAAEQDVLRRVPEAGANLLANIPCLEPVAQAIRYSGKNFDGGGWPITGPVGPDLPLGSRLLRVLSGMDHLAAGGLSPRDALTAMQRHADRYDPRVVAAALKCFGQDRGVEPVPAVRTSVLVAVEDLKVGQTLAADVEASDGKLLISSGHCLTESLLERLHNFAAVGLFKELVRIECDAP